MLQTKCNTELLHDRVSGLPVWVKDIFKCSPETSAELRSVKDTLGTRADIGDAGDTSEGDLRPTQSQAESPVIRGHRGVAL